MKKIAERKEIGKDRGGRGRAMYREGGKRGKAKNGGEREREKKEV